MRTQLVLHPNKHLLKVSAIIRKMASWPLRLTRKTIRTSETSLANQETTAMALPVITRAVVRAYPGQIVLPSFRIGGSDSHLELQ
jgi:hypothetical protein